jgi:hypothetical protein
VTLDLRLTDVEPELAATISALPDSVQRNLAVAVTERLLVDASMNAATEVREV